MCVVCVAFDDVVAIWSGWPIRKVAGSLMALMVSNGASSCKELLTEVALEEMYNVQKKPESAVDLVQHN